MGHRHFPDNFKDFASLTLFDGIPQFSGKPISHGKQIHLGTGQKLYHILAGTCINPSHFEFINFSQDPSRSWGPTPGSTHRIRPPCQKSAGWMMGQRVNKTWSKKRVAQREKIGDLPGKNWENLGWNVLFNQQLRGWLVETWEKWYRSSKRWELWHAAWRGGVRWLPTPMEIWPVRNGMTYFPIPREEPARIGQDIYQESDMACWKTSVLTAPFYKKHSTEWFYAWVLATWVFASLISLTQPTGLLFNPFKPRSVRKVV